MHLVGGSEGSLLFNTSHQIIGYDPGVNSINHFFLLYRLLQKDYRETAIITFVYSICLSISAAARAISRKAYFTPIRDACIKKQSPDDYPPIQPNKHPRYITMSIFKTQPQHRLNSVNYMCWKNLVRTALEKVEAFDIATGTETYPQTGGSASAIQAKQRDYRK